MAEAQLVELFVTCKGWQSAQALADELMQQQVAMAVEFVPMSSHAAGTRKTEGVKLIVQTTTQNVPGVEATAKRLKGSIHGQPGA